MNFPGNHGMQPAGAHTRQRKVVLLSLTVVAVLLLVSTAGANYWYRSNVAAVGSGSETRLFVVQEGDSTGAVAERLQRQGFIRSELAFRIAVRLAGDSAAIKAGEYQLAPSEDVAQILAKFNSGAEGATITDISIIPGSTLRDIETVLIKAGYAEADVEAALAQKYEHPLLADKPAEATLEGYIYPDTYEVELAAGPEQLLQKSFDNFYQKLEAAELSGEGAFGSSRFDLHEAIIFGSVIEKEVNTVEDRPIVAQIFLKRLDIGMRLDSDATFVYAARQQGVPPSVTLDSPYNTRQVAGLPPGPIANMTMDALEATAKPAGTDYLYFLTGDDNVTHYAATDAEHNQNVENYCGRRCEL